jgi:hypothetical protein
MKPALILLCHKINRFVTRWQHGQRGMERARARAMTSLMEVMEFPT